jgi:polysaccharide export outer membrane protein
MSGEFTVGSDGMIGLPLIGDVSAQDKTPTELAAIITARIADGYLRNPSVSVEVLNFRPFYILGEVNKPGEYPYSNGLSVLNAVAKAEGFTYRADKRRVFIKSTANGSERRESLTSSTMVQPGDTVRIGERFF